MRADDPAIRSDLAEALAQAGRGDEALAEHREALRLSPRDPLLRFRHAETLARLARYPDAIREITIALESAPREPELLLRLAAYNAQSNHAEEAMAALSRAVQAGFSDMSRLSADPALASLRGRSDFQALIARRP